MPPQPSYRPDPRFPALGPDFSDPVSPAQFPNLRLRRRNQRWAERVGLGSLSEAEWTAHFGRLGPLPGNISPPVAMRYHGHQFRTYNPDIGDGRGFLFAQLRDDQNRLLDLATKGSGQTPYSRFGDGKLTLKGGVREVLAAEMLEALGVYTSKAFSLFETGEALERNDEPSPTRASVLVRLSHSHIRFGTFQRAAFFGRGDMINALIDHCVENYHPQLAEFEGEKRVAEFLAAVARASAKLAASWMAAGFVHGVLNTDNMTITGESFDYGPWRFLPSSQPSFTAAYFDQSGLYAFGRQPEAVSWNLAQLAGALSVVCEQDPLMEAVRAYPTAYRDALRETMFQRLGLKTGDMTLDLQFLQALFEWMTQSEVGWDQFFFDWFCGASDRATRSPHAAAYASAEFETLRADIEARTPDRPERLKHPAFSREAPPSLLIDEVESLWEPIAAHDDWSAFEAKLKQIAEWREALAFHSSAG